MRNLDSHELDAMLRHAATAQRTPAEEERIFSDVWSRVQTSIDEDSTPARDELQQRRLNLIGDREVAARRRRRAARVASVTLAVVVAGAGTAAAAEFLSTRTGEQSTGADVQIAGPGEFLNQGGTDRRQVYEEVTADIAFAPGYEAQRDYALEFFPHESDSAITESALRSFVAGNAICTWADAWVAGDNAGDITAREAAAAMLTGVVSWEPIQTFNETQGEPDPMDPSTGVDPSAGGSYYGWLRPLVQAAQSGDRQGILDAVAIAHRCSPEVLPVISTDPNYAGAR
ncbi:hypothetical protein [Modestobacter sp. SYSU DS0290]